MNDLHVVSHLIKVENQGCYIYYMVKKIKYEMAVIVAVAIGISYVLFLVFVTPFMDNARPHQQSEPAVSTVVFVEGASLATAPNNGIEPKIVTVIVGLNNTVRWINQDTIPHGIPTPDDDNVDPDFAKAVLLEESKNHFFIMPGGKDSFQFTFTNLGQIDYHMVPHPQMRGTVIVLSNSAPKTEAPPIISGIACNRTEQLVYHIHAHLALFVNGTRVQVPANIGVLSSSQCFYWLHTHSNDGVIHVESPKVKTFTLGQFLEIWKQTGDNGGSFFSSVSSLPLRIYVNGTEFAGNYDDLKLNSREQITLAYGSPPGSIPSYDFGNLDKPRVNNTEIQ